MPVRKSKKQRKTTNKKDTLKAKAKAVASAGVSGNIYGNITIRTAQASRPLNPPRLLPPAPPSAPIPFPVPTPIITPQGPIMPTQFQGLEQAIKQLSQQLTTTSLPTYNPPTNINQPTARNQAQEIVGREEGEGQALEDVPVKTGYEIFGMSSRDFSASMPPTLDVSFSATNTPRIQAGRSLPIVSGDDNVNRVMTDLQPRPVNVADQTYTPFSRRTEAEKDLLLNEFDNIKNDNPGLSNEKIYKQIAESLGIPKARVKKSVLEKKRQ